MKQATEYDICNEQVRQFNKWGEQNHPDGTGRGYEYLASAHRRLCDARHFRGDGTWADILLEEVYEALSESDLAKLRTELIQVAAVAATWVDAIDRRQEV